MQKRLVVGYDHGDEMSEWQETTLENAPLEIIDGDRGVNYPSQSEFTAQGYCLFLNAGNVTTTGFDFSNCAFITAERDSLLRKGKLSQNDVILTTRGTVGNTAYFDHSVPFRNIRINSGMVILRADTSLLYPRYLYIFVRSAIFLAQVLALRTGSAQPQLPIRDMKRIKIPLPPLPIQHAIAHILGSLDDKIELNRRMNETLEAMARALFKDWFVEFGPVRAKMEGRQPPGLSAEVAALFPDALDAEGKPVGWEILPLDEVADFLNGLALQKFPGDAVDDLPIIKIAELRAGLVDNGIRASKTIPSQYVIENGDVIFSWSGSLIQRIWTSGKGALNQHLFKVTSTRFPKWFHYYWVEHHLPNFQAIAASKATTMGHIQRHHLSEAETIVGDDALMKAADDMFAPFFNQIVANSLESHTLAALRDLLLPKLLSGELRVRPPCDSRTTPDENSR